MNLANVLIVDDEPLARATLVKLLEPETQMRVVAEAGSGTAALALMQTTMLDLVFLDLNLPDMTGIEVLQKIPAGRRPPVIFVTARDDFAVKAFELHAIDYLVKPFTDDRFYRAIARVQRQPRLTALAESVDTLLRHWQPTPRPAPAAAVPAREHPEQFTAKSGGDIHVFQFENIKWVEAQGDYLRIHSTKGRALVRETMRRFLERAAGGRFVRVHKSAIVNLAFVKRLEPIHSGDYRLELNDGAVLRVSRHFREAVQAALLR